MDPEIVDAEIIEPEIITGNERQLDGLSLISFITSFVVFLYPFNAIIAVVLSITSRATRKRSGRWGRGFARAAWIIATVQLAFGLLIALAILLSPLVRANETAQPIPTQTPICAADLHDCKLVDDGVDGANTFGRTIKNLWEGTLGD